MKDVKNNKLTMRDFISHIFSSEARADRLTTYAFFIVILLVIIAIQLGSIVKNISKIALGTKSYTFVNSTVMDNGETLYYTETTLVEENGEQTTEPNSDDPFYVFSAAETTTLYTNYIDSYLPSSTTTAATGNADVATTTTNNSSNKGPSTTAPNTQATRPQSSTVAYAININSKKIHYVDCSYAEKMKPENKLVVVLTKKQLQDDYLSQGYTFCSKCAG